MEIADAFIINKADRPDADLFSNNLEKIAHQKKDGLIPVFKTIASKNEGIDEIANFIKSVRGVKNSRKDFLLTEKAYKLIQQKRMRGVDKKILQQAIANAINEPNFNLYSFVESY